MSSSGSKPRHAIPWWVAYPPWWIFPPLVLVVVLWRISYWAGVAAGLATPWVVLFAARRLHRAFPVIYVPRIGQWGVLISIVLAEVVFAVTLAPWIAIGTLAAAFALVLAWWMWRGRRTEAPHPAGPAPASRRSFAVLYLVLVIPMFAAIGHGTWRAWPQPTPFAFREPRLTRPPIDADALAVGDRVAAAIAAHDDRTVDTFVVSDFENDAFGTEVPQVLPRDTKLLRDPPAETTWKRTVRHTHWVRYHWTAVSPTGYCDDAWANLELGKANAQWRVIRIGETSWARSSCD